MLKIKYSSFCPFFLPFNLTLLTVFEIFSSDIYQHITPLCFYFFILCGIHWLHDLTVDLTLLHLYLQLSTPHLPESKINFWWNYWLMLKCLIIIKYFLLPPCPLEQNYYFLSHFMHLIYQLKLNHLLSLFLLFWLCPFPCCKSLPLY